MAEAVEIAEGAIQKRIAAARRCIWGRLAKLKPGSVAPYCSAVVVHWTLIVWLRGTRAAVTRWQRDGTIRGGEV